MDFEWTWEAVAAFGAIAVSLVAVGVAVRANRLVGVYKRALLTAEAGPHPLNSEIAVIHISNHGESPASRVRLALDADPLHLWVSDDVIELLGPGSSDFITTTLPPTPHSNHPGGTWHFFSTRAEGARMGTVTWLDLEGKSRTVRVSISTGEWPQG